jgi:hypothetical protein
MFVGTGQLVNFAFHPWGQVDFVGVAMDVAAINPRTLACIVTR